MRIYTVAYAFLNYWSKGLVIKQRACFSRHPAHLDNCNAKYLLRRQRDTLFSCGNIKELLFQGKLHWKKNNCLQYETKFLSSGTFSCLFILQEWTRFKPSSQCDNVARQLIKRKIRELYKMAGALAESTF